MPKVIVKPGTVVTDRSFQTASWWARIELTPGEYEFNDPTAWGGCYCTIPGIIVEDYFASRFGASYGSYDRTKNAGKPTSYSVFRYLYELKNNDTVILSGKC